MDLEEIEYQILHGKSIEEIIKEFDWRGFEDLCSSILAEHGWKTKKNFRFKTEKRYEIDILAEKGEKILLIDCKQWGERPGKASQLKISAKKQLERAKEWEKINFLNRVGKELKTLPIIITWLEEGITRENGVLIVPVFTFNTFLLEIDKYVR
ncbi:MAG: restriction endonuclease [Candidatus Aenigmatarchaeota archaeon]|nr:MAG: restriction endonuclease [Candidatus Aenigmarchaeota archaeon]